MVWRPKCKTRNYKILRGKHRQKTQRHKSKQNLLWPTSSVQFSSVAQSCLTLWPHESQHARPPCPSPTPGVYSNPCPSSRWCHPTVSSSVIPFYSCSQSLPASGSFPMSQPFAWAGQSIGVSASTSVLPMNTQDWSPLGWTGWISLQSKGLSRVFSNTIVQKHQFFDTPPRVTEIKTKVNKWDLAKPKNFCTAKETISKVKRQPSEWEKIIANEKTDKGLIFKIYKQIIEVNTRKTNRSKKKS